jgi:hypothetical protein
VQDLLADRNDGCGESDPTIRGHDGSLALSVLVVDDDAVLVKLGPRSSSNMVSLL